MKRILSLPLILLMFMLPGVAIALASDRVVRDQMQAAGIHVPNLPGMAIPFSGSYLVGFLFGLVVVIVKEILFCIIRKYNENFFVVLITRLGSPWPKARRGFLFGIPILVVLLLCRYMIVGVAWGYILMGMMPALGVDGYVHSQGKLSQAETVPNQSVHL